MKTEKDGGPLNATNSILFGAYFQSGPIGITTETTNKQVMSEDPGKEFKPSGRIYPAKLVILYI